MGGAELFGTLIKVLIVFGLLFGTLRVLARYQGGGRPVRVSGGGRRSAGAQQSVIEVVEQVRVGRAASVITVRLGDRHVALAITDQSVTNLGDVAVAEAEPTADHVVEPPPNLLNAALDVLRDRTTRR